MFKRGAKNELLNLHSTISPIYDTVDDQSYTVSKATADMERTYNMNTTVINTATMIKKSSAKRDILSVKTSPEKKMSAPIPVQRLAPSRISPTETGKYFQFLHALIFKSRTKRISKSMQRIANTKFFLSKISLEPVSPVI